MADGRYQARNHDHHDHDHGKGHGGQTLKFTARKPSKVRQHQSDASYSIEGMTGGHFAVASSRKHLKQLMNSEADMVYDQTKGNLYLNTNGEMKGWGKKRVGGLIARFQGKPELEAGHFKDMKLFDGDELTGDKSSNGQHDQGHGHTDGDRGETSMETMFTSRKAAQKAAKDFGCKGAHQMGDSWMPCKDHGTIMIEQDNHSGHNHSVKGSDHDHSGHKNSGYDHSGYDDSGYNNSGYNDSGYDYSGY